VEDVLAAVAARLGAPWDGPGDPRAVDVHVELDRPPWEILDATREQLVAADPEARRRLGAHHTPPALASKLAALAIDDATSAVADPACGGGSFLVAAGEALVRRGADRRTVVERQLHGVDVDPLAAATTRAVLALWSGGGRACIDVGDGLTWRPPAPVDVVVGNPPFRSPLAAGARRGGLAPYTDLAGRFLVAALDLVRPEGRVLMLQPESVLAARDAAPVRAAGALDGLWLDDAAVFAADVRVCALLLRRSPHQRSTVARWVGTDVSPAAAAELDDAAPTWAHLRPDAPPSPPAGTRTIGDIASATAGFRQHFYGVAAATRESGDGPPVVTSGLIDPGRLLWGERPARIAGRRYERPTVDLGVLSPDISGWVHARRTPKVLVATQTRSVEAVADPTGDTVPLTPVIAVHPRDPADVERIVEALSSERATAWARRHYAGTGLGRGAFRLSARQVLAVPLV
jgi:hypothetical protein